MPKRKTKPKQLERGRQWHAWVWKASKTSKHPAYLAWWAVGYPSDDERPHTRGKWVRVKFVEV